MESPAPSPIRQIIFWQSRNHPWFLHNLAISDISNLWIAGIEIQMRVFRVFVEIRKWERMMRLTFGMSVLLLTAACGDGSSNKNASADNSTSDRSIATVVAPTPENIALAQDLVPDSPELAAKYDRSCRTCHSLADAKAPLTGHAEDWQARLAGKEPETVLANIRNGLNAMPPMGLCNDCSDAELVDLTHFMAGTKTQ